MLIFNTCIGIFLFHVDILVIESSRPTERRLLDTVAYRQKIKLINTTENNYFTFINCNSATVWIAVNMVTQAAVSNRIVCN